MRLSQHSWLLDVSRRVPLPRLSRQDPPHTPRSPRSWASPGAPAPAAELARPPHPRLTDCFLSATLLRCCWLVWRPSAVQASASASAWYGSTRPGLCLALSPSPASAAALHPGCAVPRLTCTHRLGVVGWISYDALTELHHSATTRRR